MADGRVLLFLARNADPGVGDRRAGENYDCYYPRRVRLGRAARPRGNLRIATILR